MYARNTLVQLLALYTDPESHNAQCHRQSDRRTDGQQDDANSRSYCVAVGSAKNYTNRSCALYNILLDCNANAIFLIRVKKAFYSCNFFYVFNLVFLI